MLLTTENPEVQEYIEIRTSSGWGKVDTAAAQKSLQHTLFSVCLRDEGKLLGLGRIIGDGVLFFFLTEVMIIPEAQGMGFGKRIMNALMDYIKEHAIPSATIGVFAGPGKEKFYEKYGFSPCPNEVFGHGMTYLQRINEDT